VEHIAKVQRVEDNLSETRLKLRKTESKCDGLSLENKRLLGELTEERKRMSSLEDNQTRLQSRLQVMKENCERFKLACIVTDKQIQEIEELLSKEQKANKTLQEKIDSINSGIREKDEQIIKLKQEIMLTKKEKDDQDRKIQQLKEEIEISRENMVEIQKKMLTHQQMLVEQTNKLFLQEEQSEVLSCEANNLQTVNENYEKEINLLKEENARILSDLFHAKEEAHRLDNELKEALAQAHEHQLDIDELQLVLKEKEEHFTQREIKSEATLAQHKKLIDYLQLKVEDLSQKKKKTFADVIFGTSGQASHKKDHISQSAIENSILYRALQEELKREQQRCKALQQQLDQLTGNYNKL